VNLFRRIVVWLALAGFALANSAAAEQTSMTVGMEQVSAPVGGDAAVPVTIWYPSVSPARSRAFGPFQLEVAIMGDPVAGRLPLIVMSHGTGGSAFGSVNLAIALAKAGFVVAALEHTGDNFHDRSRSFTWANFASRPHQVRAAIDFLLNTWRRKSAINPDRIGMFGHSAGGTTSLIVGGGVLDYGQVVRFCVSHPEDWGCKQGSQRVQTRPSAESDVPPVSEADSRVKALVIAAPALAPGFATSGLAKLKPAVQLWVAGRDVIVVDAGRMSAWMPAKPERHDIEDAGHFSFLVPCSDVLRTAAPEICADQPGFDRAAFQQEFTTAVIRFFRKRLPE
jgi:predicted dienelactone hydrolase